MHACMLHSHDAIVRSTNKALHGAYLGVLHGGLGLALQHRQPLHGALKVLHLPGHNKYAIYLSCIVQVIYLQLTGSS